MNSFNKFCVIGRLTKDPELKTLENGTKVCNITLAVDRDYKTKDNKKITDFLNYPLWNKDAERISNYSKKGSLVLLEGYITSKEIETEKGKITIMQPVVDNYKHIALSKNNDIDNEISSETEMEK